MQVFRRRLSPIVFAASQPRTLELPRNYCLRSLNLWLDGIVTLATGTAGGPMDSCPSQLVQRIEIIRDGSETIKSIDFETLHRLTQRRYGVRPRIDSLPAGFAAIASEPVEVHARMDFAMWPGHFRPVDTMLDASRCTTLGMVVTFGNPSEIMIPTYNGTVAVVSAQLNVETTEMTEVPKDWAFNDFKEHRLQKQVTAAQNDFEIGDLANGNYYRGFTIKTTRNGMPSNAIINEITLKSGTKVWMKVKAKQLQFENRLDAGLEIPSGNDTVNSEYLTNIMTGYYYVDLCLDGRLMESLYTGNLSSLEFVFDVNNPGANTDYIFIYPEEIVLAPVKEPPKAV